MGCSTRHYVDQLAAPNVDDRSAPLLDTPPALTPEQRFLSTPTAPTSPIRSPSASNSASPQRPTSLFTVCHPQPSSVATSSTERPRRPTWTVTHRAAPDVNNARSGPIVGSCSTNDLSAHPGFGHVQRRFRHPNTHRPTERRQIHQHRCPKALRPHRPATALTHRTGLAGPDHHPKRCPLTPLVDPHQINLAQAYQQLAHARRDQLPQGSSCLGCVFPTPDYGGPLPTSGGFQLHFTLLGSSGV